MRKYINYFIIALLAMTLCACGKTTDNLQEAAQEEVIESSISEENLNEYSSIVESSEIQSTDAINEIKGKDLPYNEYEMEIVTVGEIEFEIPKDWTSSFKQIKENIYYYYDDLMIMIQNTKTELDNYNLMLEKDDYISGVLGDEGEGKLVSDEVIEISGIKALKLVFKKNISGEEQNIQSVTFIYNDILYTFGWCKSNELTDDYINGFNIFVNSIRKSLPNEDADKLIGKIINDVKTESETEEPASDNTKNKENTNSTSTTTGQSNALKKAQSYLKFTNFSHDGLVEQLEYEGFSHDEAVYGADNCGADWNEQAKEKAKSYLDFSGFSYKGIIEQLEYEKFTSEQAKYGADNCGADWYEQAKEKAASYLSISSFSKSGLIEQLEYEGFTHDQAVYGAEQNGY